MPDYREALEAMLHTVASATGRIQLAFRDDEDLAPEILADFDLLVSACGKARRALTPRDEDDRCHYCGLRNPGPEHRSHAPMLCSERPKT